MRAATRAGVIEWARAHASPWIYTPEALPGQRRGDARGRLGGARAAAAPTLTLVQLERGQAWQVPGDQVAVPTELGTTVVLGGDGADVGAAFVDRVRLVDQAVTLERIPCAGEPRS